jgi:tetratricopeptide (TPR) repeat protein
MNSPAPSPAGVLARIPPYWLLMGVLFSGALGIGYELLPGQVERIAMLERDGQAVQARDILERNFERGDRSARTLYQLEALYEHFGQLDKAQTVLKHLLDTRPRDPNVQKRAAQFFKQTQDEPAYVRAVNAQISLRYSEDACKELIGIHRRNAAAADELAAIQLCRSRGYRRPEDTVRLASLVAADGDLAQASSLLRSVDDLRRLKSERDRTQLFATLLEIDQPREAHRRATRWLSGARDLRLALSLLELLANDNRHELAIGLARDISVPGDAISLAVAELMLDRGEPTAARNYLHGWIEKAEVDSADLISRFITACLDAEDPENALTGAKRYGLAKLQQTDLVALAEALAAIGLQSEFDAVRAVIAPHVLAANPLLGAAVALQRGIQGTTQLLLAQVAVDDLDEWRLSLWARLMTRTGQATTVNATLQHLGVDAQSQGRMSDAQAQKTPEVQPILRRTRKTVRRPRFHSLQSVSAIRARQGVPVQQKQGPSLFGSGG